MPPFIKYSSSFLLSILILSFMTLFCLFFEVTKHLIILLGFKLFSKSMKSKVSSPVILRFFALSLPKNCKGKN